MVINTVSKVINTARKIDRNLPAASRAVGKAMQNYATKKADKAEWKWLNTLNKLDSGNYWPVGKKILGKVEEKQFNNLKKATRVERAVNKYVNNKTAKATKK